MRTKHLLMMLCGSLMFASCNKHNENQGITPPRAKFTIIASQYEPTRTTLDGNQVLWADGDQLAVTTYPAAGAQSLLFNLTSGAGTKEGTFIGPALTAGQYIAFYPYLEEQPAPPITADNAFDLTFQKQFENTTEHIGKYDFLYSKPVIVKEGSTQADFGFTHALSLHELRIYLKSGSTMTDGTIGKVTFAAHKEDGTPVQVFGTSVYYDMSGNKIVAGGTAAEYSIQVSSSQPLQSDTYFPVYAVLDHEQVSNYPYQIDLKIDISSASAGNFTFTQKNIKTIAAEGQEYQAGVKYTNKSTRIEVDAPAATYFPDANFRAALKALQPDLKEENGDIDPTDPANVALLEKITMLQLIGNGSNSISTLKGIEYLKNLGGIMCVRHSLLTLDMSANQNLEMAIITANSLLTSVNVSGCVKLTQMTAEGNQTLSSLNASGCTALTDLKCSENTLVELNVAGCTALSKLECNKNQLVSLDVSECAAMSDLVCDSNQLTSLNVSGCAKLYSIRCGKNKLISLDLSEVPALFYLNCNNNLLETLNTSKCPILANLYCSSNSLTSLDVSSNTELTELQCYDNAMDKLDIQSLVKLRNSASALVCGAQKEKQLTLTLTQTQAETWNTVWLPGNPEKNNRVDLDVIP